MRDNLDCGGAALGIKNREADRSVSNGRRHTERSNGKIGTAGRGINKNANHVENERKVPNNELLGKSNVVTRNREKEKPFIVEAYSAAGMTEFAHGMKRKMVEQHEFLALMSERDTLFTAKHHHMPLMLTSGRASALVQVENQETGWQLGAFLHEVTLPEYVSCENVMCEKQTSVS